MSLNDGFRKIAIKSLQIRSAKRGERGFPHEDSFEGRQVPAEAWTVTLTLQEGLLPERNSRCHFDSEEVAEAFMAEHPIGSEYQDNLHDLIFSSIKNLDQFIELGYFPIKAGSSPSNLPSDILLTAGILDENSKFPARKVLDHLGRDRVEQLRRTYDETWDIVACFEYCWIHLPHSSPAFIAAASKFCHWVLRDGFREGYLLRDLEIITGGVEAQAVRAIETRKKAGDSGSRKSTEARDSRIAAFWQALEDVADRNPDIVSLGEKAIAKLALENAAKKNPKLWRQGRGQVHEYLGEIRRGEAGAEMQERYRALFGSKPLRQF